MIENPLERLCESRHRWLIVTAVTIVIGLAFILPQVDQLIAERSERTELQERLAQAVETSERLPMYQERVAEKVAELTALQEREVDEARLAELRSWLVAAARQSGCQVRRIDFASPVIRPWTTDDHPIEPPSKGDKRGAETPFELQTRPVAFSVTGTTAEVLALLESIDRDQRLKHTNSLDLKPTSRNSQELQLELNLWYFALVKSKGVA